MNSVNQFVQANTPLWNKAVNQLGVQPQELAFPDVMQNVQNTAGQMLENQTAQSGNNLNMQMQQQMQQQQQAQAQQQAQQGISQGMQQMQQPNQLIQQFLSMLGG